MDEKRIGMEHGTPGGEKRRPAELGLAFLQLCQDSGISYTYDQRTEEFYRWDGQQWSPQLKEKMEQRAYQLDAFEFCSHARARETVQYLKAATGQDDVEWDTLPSGLLPLEGGVLSFMGEAPKVEPHDKKMHYTYCLPIEHDAEATSPTWAAAIAKWFDGTDDAQAKKDALQEYMGYCLLAHAKYKKALMLVGESNTGKSRVEAAIRMLVGQRLCTSVRLEAFNTSRFPFGLEDLLGKQVNFISEPSKGDLLNDGMFKQVVSGSDAVTVHRKNQKGVTTVLRAKHVIATNTMPIIKDESKGTWSRLLIIPFDNVLEAHEQDPEFDAKLKQELPGLLNWCIEGARRLVAHNGRFTYVPSGEEVAEEHRLESNPMLLFSQTQIKLDPTSAGLTSAEIAERFKKVNDHAAARGASIRDVEGWLSQLGIKPAPSRINGADQRKSKVTDPTSGHRVYAKVYPGYRLAGYGF